MALESVVKESINKDDHKIIDREKTCPLLLRVFCHIGRHNSVNEYNEGSLPPNELQIYTWMDATLRELSQLVKEVNPDARKPGTVFDFSLVYPDRNRRCYRARSVGTTVSQSKTGDDMKTLTKIEFTIGDFLDIAITPGSRIQRDEMPNRSFLIRRTRVDSPPPRHSYLHYP